jgi:alpha-N-acetylglucosaminidase
MKHLATLLVVLALCVGTSIAANFNGIESMLKRRLPFLSTKLVFRELSKPLTDGAKDAFRLYQSGNQITIEAASTSAAAAAVNHYLRYHCKMSISHSANNLQPLQPLQPLPSIADTIVVQSPFVWRYALNYCTYNYTYSFYSWEDWERELDWMALNGINLMLAPVGTEILWQRTLASLGFTDEEIRRYLPGPAYNAWWLMGNLEGWGGPVSDNIITKWSLMQQKILRRMKELGITPVLQGFCGIVPHTLKEKFPQAQIIPQGTWAGGFVRPAVLLPQDTLFARIAALYYGYMKEVYGNDINDMNDMNSNVLFLGGDLFHEGGKTDGIDITQTARLVQGNMVKHFPQTSWVLQGWGGNPKDALLAGLDPSRTLIIDLFGESQQNWKKRKEYGGFPWIWASVNNFGGKVGIGAQLPTLIEEPHRAYEFSMNNSTNNSTNNSMGGSTNVSVDGHLRGIGIIPEGIDANPVVYDWALETAWRTTMPSADDFLRQYIVYRYGAWNENLYTAWKLMLSSVYGDYERKGEGTFESIFCARPGLKIRSVSTWGPRALQYDPAPLKQALALMRSEAGKFNGNAAFRYDITDLARQTLANQARSVYADIVAAFSNKDKAALRRHGNRFLSMMMRQDSLLRTNEHFLVGRWIEQARRFGGANADDARLCVWNARTQITYWGPDNPATDLHDYAHKEWSGILQDLYLRRWTLFLDDLSGQLDGKTAAAIDYFALEKQWADADNSYPIVPAGDYLAEIDKVVGEL